MKIQPGVGYTFDSSDKGFTLDTSDPFPDRDGSTFYQQFECKVEAETEGGVTKFYLKTRKGVVDYSKSGFPFAPGGSYPSAAGGPTMFSWTEKQARMNDWAVYANGTRTAGTATDGPDFQWMANNGKIELPTGESGLSMLVTISMIDWYDLAGTHAGDRLIDAEMPFVSVFDASDTTMIDRIQVPTYSSISGRTMYIQEGAVDDGSSVPERIGYTYKKIAQLDWNDTTNKWDVTQYEYGPIDLRINWTETVSLAWSTAPDPSLFDDAAANDFDNVSNYAWFESMWAIPGYTMNPSNWWTHLVNS